MRFTYFLFILFLVLSCSKKPSAPEEVILARVGEKLITIQDFIRRSEYTIRPDYCKQDNTFVPVSLNDSLSLFKSIKPAVADEEKLSAKPLSV